MSNALRRIDTAISETLPEGVFETFLPENADVVINGIVNISDVQVFEGKRNILWQLCYKTAGGTEEEWMEIWKQYDLVVSYFDLPLDNYLRLPLGYDPEMFYNIKAPKIYDAIVTGYVDGVEGEVIIDAHKAFGNIMHIGPDYKLGNGYNNCQNVTDGVMRQLYQQSKYVLGLRYVEGFELPLVEGGACGAIPVTFDLECYSHWFDDYALFVQPDAPIVPQLKAIKNLYYRQPKSDFSAFTWDNIMKKFWKGVRYGLV